MREARWAIIILASLLGSGEARGQERTFISVGWELAWEIPPALESDLQLPWALQPLSDGSIVLFDFGDRRVKRFSPPGHLAWSVGGQGQGPGEYTGPSDLKVDERDRIWVLDGDGRVTQRDGATGQLLSTSRAMGMHRLLPLPSGDLIVTPNPAGSPLLVLMGEDGAQEDWSPPHFDTEMAALEREAFIDGFRNIQTGIVAFRRAGKIVLLELSEEGLEGAMTDAVEPSEFPGTVSLASPSGATVQRTAPRSFEAARWIGHDADFFYVGFAGESGARTVVDLYATRDGEYRGSLRLPMEVDNGTVVGRRTIAGLSREPVPHIKVWRWRSDPEMRFP